MELKCKNVQIKMVQVCHKRGLIQVLEEICRTKCGEVQGKFAFSICFDGSELNFFIGKREVDRIGT